LANAKQESIQVFLEQIKGVNTQYPTIVVIWDNYLSHKSAKVIKAAAARLSIYLVYLPPYSPDLNPEVYLWKSMKRELSKDFIKTINEMKASINKVWNELSGSLTSAPTH
jgi:transposase